MALFIPCKSLEPEAVTDWPSSGATIDSAVGSAAINLSKAISAKRQADALERIANQLDGTAKGATVHDFIGYIADAARNG